MKNPLSTIANLANKQPKSKKQDVLEDFLVFLQLNKDIIPENQDTFAKIYQFLTPATPARPKTPIQAMAHCLAKNDVRPFLKHIYVTKDYLYSADGHRLARYPNKNNLETGYYDKNLNAIECEFSYPDAESLFHGYTDKFNVDLSKVIRKRTPLDVMVFSTSCEPKHGIDFTINIQYELIKPFIVGESNVTIHHKDFKDTSPILIKMFDDLEIIIMPVRV